MVETDNITESTMELASTCIELAPSPNSERRPSADCVTAPAEAWQLGQLLIARGDISTEQLSLALAGQRSSGRRLGEELISAGVVKGPQIDFVLRIQQRLATVAKLSHLL